MHSSRANIFGPFDVFERLGLGGMAVVNRAVQRSEGPDAPDLALKRLLPHLVEQPEYVDAFARESQIACLLDHRHIVRSHGYGRVGDVPFLVMEYLPGHNLVEILKEAARMPAPPPLAVAVQLLCDLLSALTYAHERVADQGEPLRLIHRDISPSNLIISREGKLKVIDFGVAKAHTARLATRSGRAKGKLSYMAPECQKGLPLDARCDLFSVGAIAHELIRARPLFSGSQQLENFRRLEGGKIEPPSSGNPLCPPALDAVVMRALAFNRDDRFGSAAEMRAELEEVAKSLPEEMQRVHVGQWLLDLWPEPTLRDTPRFARPGSEAVENAIDSLVEKDDEVEFWPAVESLTGTTQITPALIDPDEPDTSKRAPSPAPPPVPGPARDPASGSGPPNTGPRSLPLPAPPQSALAATPSPDGGNKLGPGLLAFRAPTEPDKTRAQTPVRNGWAAGTTPPTADKPMEPPFRLPPSMTPRGTGPMATQPDTDDEPTSPADGLFGRRLATIAAISILAVATGLLGAVFLRSGDIAARRGAGLKVEVDPPGAAVSINGDPGPGDTKLAPGTHVISASHPGYKSAAVTIQADSGEQHHVHIVLRQVEPRSVP